MSSARLTPWAAALLLLLVAVPPPAVQASSLEDYIRLRQSLARSPSAPAREELERRTERLRGELLVAAARSSRVIVPNEQQRGYEAEGARPPPPWSSARKRARRPPYGGRPTSGSARSSPPWSSSPTPSRYCHDAGHAVRGRHAHRQPRGHDPARAARAQGGGPGRLRGHAAHAHAPHPLRHPRAGDLLLRA